MQDSKLDDKPRRLAKEWLKYLLYKPYKAALVGTPRSREYLAFLGLPEERIVVGYDALSLDRVAGLARAEPAPLGVPHGERHFTIIARFVPAKNLAMAIDAYAAFRREHPGTTRELHLCGSGPLEEGLKAQVARLGLEGVQFRGYLQEAEIAATLASTLALILSSTEEPFGLVVNEALALGVPVLLSENCGARDLLMRSAVNGYVFEPDNVDGLAHFMGLLHRDGDEWARLAANSQRFRDAADTGWFVRGVLQVLDALAGRGRAAPRRRPRLFETSWEQSRGPAPRDPEQTVASTEGVP
jgi:glycosyltransferase involved in cell wall biosynthesis